MSDLFELPESLSPRLKWMRTHGITTEFFPERDEWEARGSNIAAFGASEDAALVDLARKIGIKDWRKA